MKDLSMDGILEVLKAFTMRSLLVSSPGQSVGCRNLWVVVYPWEDRFWYEVDTQSGDPKVFGTLNEALKAFILL